MNPLAVSHHRIDHLYHQLAFILALEVALLLAAVSLPSTPHTSRFGQNQSMLPAVVNQQPQAVTPTVLLSVQLCVQQLSRSTHRHTQLSLSPSLQQDKNNFPIPPQSLLLPSVTIVAAYTIFSSPLSKSLRTDVCDCGPDLGRVESSQVKLELPSWLSEFTQQKTGVFFHTTTYFG